MKAKLVSQVRQAKFDLLPQLPLRMPFVLYVEPSGFCNLKCHFCPQSDKSFQMKKATMPLALWGKIMREVKEWPDKLKMLRVCGNGEPLTNNRILDFLMYAKGMDVSEKTEIVTNGTLLNKTLIKMMPMYVDRIVVSIYSLDLEGTPLLKNIYKLHEKSDSCTIHVKTSHQVANTEELRSKFYGLFGDHCDEIFIENIVPMWPEVVLPGADRTRWGGEIVPRRVCSQMFKGFQVQADGECVPCCVDWKRVNVIGDATKQTLQEIWDGAPLARLQREHYDGRKNQTEPCKSCLMNELCDVDNIDEYRGEA